MQVTDSTQTLTPETPTYYRPNFRSQGTYLDLVACILPYQKVTLPPRFIPQYYKAINAADSRLPVIGFDVLPTDLETLIIDRMTADIVLPLNLLHLFVWDLVNSTVVPGSEAIPQGCKFYINVAHRGYADRFGLGIHYLFTLRPEITDEEMEGDKYDLEEKGTYLTVGPRTFTIVKRTPKGLKPIIEAEPVLEAEPEPEPMPVITAITVSIGTINDIITMLETAQMTIDGVQQTISNLLAAAKLMASIHDSM